MLKVQQLLHICSEHFDTKEKEEDKEKKDKKEKDKKESSADMGAHQVGRAGGSPAGAGLGRRAPLLGPFPGGETPGSTGDLSWPYWICGRGTGLQQNCPLSEPASAGGGQRQLPGPEMRAFQRGRVGWAGWGFCTAESR